MAKRVRERERHTHQSESSVIQCCAAHLLLCYLMAILYHFPIFHSLSSPKLSSSFHIPSPYSRLRRHHNYRCSTISASSSNKPPRLLPLLLFVQYGMFSRQALWDVVFFMTLPFSVSCWIVFRAIKKSKSDEDLRNDIKDFLSRVGLPENHLPTMKELSFHGRFDFYGFSRSEIWMQGSNFPVFNALIESCCWCFSSVLSYFAVMYNSSNIGQVALSGELNTLFCSLSKSY